MAGYTAQRPLRIAVGQIADYTGKIESDDSGRKLTQGAALMAMSALAKAGVHLVERFDTSVAEMELKYANNKLIGGSDQPQAGPGDYRQIMAGSIPGSDYYLVGGITELNFNIRSEGANGDGGGTATNGVKGTASGQPLRHERRPRPSPGRHQHAGGRGRDLLPEADHRPSGPAGVFDFLGTDLLRCQRSAKARWSRSSLPFARSSSARCWR